MVFSGLFWKLWSYFGVFGKTFYAFSLLKGEIGGKTRLEQSNPTKSQADTKPKQSLQPTSSYITQPGLWARVKAQWVTQQCSSLAQ